MDANWRLHLAGLVAGASAWVSCSSQPAPAPSPAKVPVCNANPDVCCMDPDSGLCVGNITDAGEDEGAPVALDSAIPACNANPDPCCLQPDSSLCEGGHTIDSGSPPLLRELEPAEAPE
jgi:hypothetical protein